METDDSVDNELESTKYGELIVLGYNGAQNSLKNGQGKRHHSRMPLDQRGNGNGIKKCRHYTVTTPQQSQAINDRNRHTVSYTVNRHETIVVEYGSDTNTDMFQVGRSSETQIDFTVVDTCLGVKNNNIEHKSYSSTISRYACRILIDREAPFDARVFAAGFDVSNNIFLGEKATKWHRKNGEWDALVTNGILVLHPSFSLDTPCLHEDKINYDSDAVREPMYEWKEVSVDGDIYTLRETRSCHQRGDRITNETNILRDGSLIDLCGATLLWRTSDGMQQSPSRSDLNLRLDELNAGKPQCPVNLNTLIVPKRKGIRYISEDRQPYVYMACGHVQGKHDWGHSPLSGECDKSSHRCPMCNGESSRILPLSMGIEPAFHIDSHHLDHAFSPCGHMASLRTVRYWSRIRLPQGANSFHAVCPFCYTLLAMDKPFVKLIFQDHCDSPLPTQQHDQCDQVVT